MKKKTYTALALALSLGSSAQAVSVAWVGGTDTNWNTGANWSGGIAPNLDGTDDAVINDGSAVVYNPGADLDPLTGSTITVSNGSSVTQTATNWQRSSGGTLTLDNATWTTASEVRNGYDNGDSGGTYNLLNGSTYTSAGEFWVGVATGVNTNVVFNLNISGGSSVDFNGGVGLWLWDADASGNDYNINFTGAGSIEGRVGYNTSASTDNAVTWEDLYAAGVLQFNGSNADAFSDHFTTSGTAGTVGYKLDAVPEPSSTALLGLAGLAMILRRKK